MNDTGEFDAYISCSMENKPKVMEVMAEIEDPKHRLKVFLPQRDLLGGLSVPLVTPELITKRY